MVSSFSWLYLDSDFDEISPRYLDVNRHIFPGNPGKEHQPGKENIFSTVCRGQTC